jgi:hypothetical protein
VASASHRDREPNPASEADGIDHVRHPSAPGNQRRVSVDRPVPHPPMGVIAAIARTNQLAAEGRSQGGSSLPVEVDPFPSGGCHDGHGRSFGGGTSRVRNLGSTRTPDEPGGIGDDDLVVSGPDHAILTQLAQDPYHDLPSRPHGLRQLPLADPDHKLGSRPVFRSRFGQALGCQVE